MLRRGLCYYQGKPCLGSSTCLDSCSDPFRCSLSKRALTRDALLIDCSPLLWSQTRVDPVEYLERVVGTLVRTLKPAWCALAVDCPDSKREKQKQVEKAKAKAEKHRDEDVAAERAEANEQEYSNVVFEYKGQRKPPPDAIKDAQKRLRDMAGANELLGGKFRVMMKRKFEADDVLATMVKRALEFDEQRATVSLVSPDKDFFQLLKYSRVRLLRPSRFSLRSEQVDETLSAPAVPVAAYKLCTQRWFREKFFDMDPARYVDFVALLGDSSDNIPGVKGCGRVNAKRLMLEFGSLDAILNAAKNDQICGKLGIEISQSQRVAYLSRELATLDETLDLPTPPGMESWEEAIRV